MLIIFVIFLFISCEKSDKGIVYVAETIDPEKLFEVASSAKAETEIETAAQSEITKFTETESGSIYENKTVYWTPGGSVWHIKRECSSLDKSKEVESGSIDEAKQAGKERVCKKCG